MQPRHSWNTNKRISLTMFNLTRHRTTMPRAKCLNRTSNLFLDAPMMVDGYRPPSSWAKDLAVWHPHDAQAVLDWDQRFATDERLLAIQANAR